MEKPDPTLLEIIFQSLPAIGVGIFGCFVRIMLIPKDGKQMSVRFIIGSFAAAGFVGLLMCLILHEYSVPESIKGFLVGISGASAVTTLELLQKKAQKMLKNVLGE